VICKPAILSLAFTLKEERHSRLSERLLRPIITQNSKVRSARKAKLRRRMLRTWSTATAWRSKNSVNGAALYFWAQKRFAKELCSCVWYPNVIWLAISRSPGSTIRGGGLLQLAVTVSLELDLLGDLLALPIERRASTRLPRVKAFT